MKPTWIVKFNFETEIEAVDEYEAVSIAERALSENGFSVTCIEKKPVEHGDLHTASGEYEESLDEAIMRRLRGGN
jgi:hypothetical protein